MNLAVTIKTLDEVISKIGYTSRIFDEKPSLEFIAKMASTLDIDDMNSKLGVHDVHLFGVCLGKVQEFCDVVSWNTNMLDVLCRYKQAIIEKDITNMRLAISSGVIKNTRDIAIISATTNMKKYINQIGGVCEDVVKFKVEGDKGVSYGVVVLFKNIKPRAILFESMTEDMYKLLEMHERKVVVDDEYMDFNEFMGNVTL